MKLPSTLIAKTEIAGPGFINFWLAEDQLANAHQQILKAGAKYGRATWGAGLKVNVEFVSANPTGPLHVGHGRGAALGDAIASLLEWTGHAVTREFYVNDAGVQIDKAAQSLWARIRQEAGYQAEVPEGGYHGEYVKENARGVLEREGRAFADLPEEEALRRCRLADRPNSAGRTGPRLGAVRRQVRRYQLGAERLRFRRGRARHPAAPEPGAHVTSPRARSGSAPPISATTRTAFSARAMARSPISRPTSRTTSISTIGASIAPSMSGAPTTTGTSPGCGLRSPRWVTLPEFFDVELVQLVRVVRGGEEVKMSKRSGEFVTLRDLYEEVGVDAARYFFLARKGASPLDFDIDLAKKQTDENPIFYVQMAHARLSGIFRTAQRDPDTVEGNLDMRGLPDPEDVELLKKLVQFPEAVEKAARDREPHRITVYLHELATVVHGWYHRTRTLGEPADVEKARLLLTRAARIVLANGLALLGISAPDRM